MTGATLCLTVSTMSMSYEVDVHQFLSDLPGQITQAKRQLFSDNLNALEFWSERLRDFVNVLFVLYRRFSEVHANVALLENLCVLSNEIRVLLARFEDNISFASDHTAGILMTAVDDDEENIDSTGLGRPRKLLTKDELERVFDIYR